ncbi:unnamed protein product, partial [Amoebophrya sp. A25]
IRSSIFGIRKHRSTIVGKLRVNFRSSTASGDSNRSSGSKGSKEPMFSGSSWDERKGEKRMLRNSENNINTGVNYQKSSRITTTTTTTSSSKQRNRNTVCDCTVHDENGNRGGSTTTTTSSGLAALSAPRAERRRNTRRSVNLKLTKAASFGAVAKSRRTFFGSVLTGGGGYLSDATYNGPNEDAADHGSPASGAHQSGQHQQSGNQQGESVEKESTADSFLNHESFETRPFDCAFWTKVQTARGTRTRYWNWKSVDHLDDLDFAAKVFAESPLLYSSLVQLREARGEEGGE